MSDNRLGVGRYEYIDLLKGFTIVWVLWMHMELPELIYPSVQMPIFFFISGTFYHAKKPTLWSQIKSDAYRLLLPALVFSIFAFIYICIKRPEAFDSDVSLIDQSLSAAIVWFLLALFYFRAIAYISVKLCHPIAVLIIALLIYVPGFYMYANNNFWILPFVPLSHMGVFMIWFAIGLLYGERILRLITGSLSRLKTIIILSAIAYILIVHGLDWDTSILAHIPWLAYGFPYTFGVIFLMLLAAYRLERISVMSRISNIFAYIGKNSIVFYLTHWPLWMYVFKPLEWNVYLSFAIIVLLEFPLIYIFNHYLPWCIGMRAIRA